MRKIKIFSIVFVLTVSTVFLFAGGFWPEIQNNSFRTGRAEMKGGIVEPQVLWNFYLGGTISQTAVFSDIENGYFYYILRGAIIKNSIDGEKIWSSGNLELNRIWGLFDLNNDSKKEVIASKTGTLFVISVDDGAVLSSIDFPGGILKVSDLDNDGLPEMITRNMWLSSGLKVYDFKNGFGTPNLKWVYSEYVPANGFELVAGDIYGETGRKDLIIDRTDGGSIITLNGANGEVISHRNKKIFFANSSYGHAELVDVTGDGKNEFVFSGSYAAANDTRTIQLTVYSPETESVLWYYEYGRKTTEKRVEMQYNSVGDMDKNGTVEIVASIYNNTLELANVGGTETPTDLDGINEENNWVAVIYDSVDGSVVTHLVNRYVDGIIDLTGDGKKELIVRKTKVGTKTLSPFSTIEIYSYNEGILTKMDEIERVAVLKKPVPMVDERGDNYTMPLPASEKFTGTGKDEILIMKDTNFDNFGDKIEILKIDENFISTSHEIILQNSRTLSFAYFNNGKLGLIGNDGVFYIYSVESSSFVPIKEVTIGNHIGNSLFLNTNKGARVLTGDSTFTTFLLDSKDADKINSPLIKWSSGNNAVQPFFAFDSNGDGFDEFIQMDMTPDLQPRIYLKDGSGSNLWIQILPSVNSMPKGFISGKFLNETSYDFSYLVDYAGLGGFAESVNGKNGELIDQHETSGIGTYYNQNLVLAGDIDVDGYDDVFAIHPSRIELLKGEDLSQVLLWNTLNWNLNGVSGDFEGDGSIDIFPNSRETGKTAYKNDGSILWAFNFDNESSYFAYDTPCPGIAKIDSDEGFDLVLGGKFGDISAYSGIDGSVLWRKCLNNGTVTDISVSVIPTSTLCSGTNLSNIVTGDIDGNGGDDFVVGDKLGNLYVVDINGELVWTMKFEGAVGNPILADVNDDGKIEILVGAGDGFLYAIGQRVFVPAPSFVRDVNVIDGEITSTADIDEMVVGESYGGLWEGVSSAAKYHVKLTDQDETVLKETMVTGANQVVFDNLEVEIGDTIYLNVKVINSGGYESAWTASDGVTIVEEDMSDEVSTESDEETDDDEATDDDTDEAPDDLSDEALAESDDDLTTDEDDAATDDLSDEALAESEEATDDDTDLSDEALAESDDDDEEIPNKNESGCGCSLI